MSVWLENEGHKIFTGGLHDYQKAAETASMCSNFTADYEEEQMADEPVSCYNCRYRRWTRESFECLQR